MILSFTVNGPPVPKARARVVNGHSYTPAKSKAYEQHVAMVARGAVSMLREWNMAGPHALTVRVYRAARRGDLDNFVKNCADALNGVAWNDDRNVVELHAAMFDDQRKTPRVEVEVRMASEEAERLRTWAEVLP